MKKNLIKILILIMSAILLCGCGETWRLRHGGNDDVDVVAGIMKSYVYNYDARQVDSMCVADGLPRDINEWTLTAYSDYETGKQIIRRLYIKEYSNSAEVIYVITDGNEKYKITKRIVTPE